MRAGRERERQRKYRRKEGKKEREGGAWRKERREMHAIKVCKSASRKEWE